MYRSGRGRKTCPHSFPSRPQSSGERAAAAWPDRPVWSRAGMLASGDLGSAACWLRASLHRHELWVPRNATLAGEVEPGEVHSPVQEWPRCPSVRRRPGSGRLPAVWAATKGRNVAMEAPEQVIALGLCPPCATGSCASELGGPRKNSLQGPALRWPGTRLDDGSVTVCWIPAAPGSHPWVPGAPWRGPPWQRCPRTLLTRCQGTTQL